MADPPTTQRAYTLRLRGETPADQSWRDWLWQTHVAVNRGAKAFGDWLLTLRGGLCHTLADARIPVGKGKPDREPTAAERRHRRIMLALSWLSVESHETDKPQRDVPAEYIVATKDGVPQTIEALQQILANRGCDASEILDWVRDCGDSLKARIRENAVWVNRSRAFDGAVQRVGPSLTRTEIWDVFERFFGDADSYLGTADAPVTEEETSDSKAQEAGEPEDSSNSEGRSNSEDKAKVLIQKAGGWLSNRYKEEGGADFASIAVVYKTLADATSRASVGIAGREFIDILASAVGQPGGGIDSVVAAVGYGGSKKKGAFFTAIEELRMAAQCDATQLNTLRTTMLERALTLDGQAADRVTKPKGPTPLSLAILRDVASQCGFPYAARLAEQFDAESDSHEGANHREYAVMLGQAAKRVSQTHSWIKLAEAERNKFEKDGRKMDKLKRERPAIVKWLDQFCRDRSRDTGTAEVAGYRIRKGAISDWADVVVKWSSAKCKTVDDRVTMAREVQADPENDKPGDNLLYEALAQEDAKLIWFVGGKPDAQPLKDYVAGREAKHNQNRRLVPAYRHPDELRHPLFGEFGNSQWSIDFAVHRRTSEKLAAAHATVERRQADVTKALAAIERAKTDEKREAAQEKLTSAQNAFNKAQRELAWLQTEQGLRMKLWDGRTLGVRPLIWHSKRVQNELVPVESTTATNAVNPPAGEPGGDSPRTQKTPNVRGLTPSASPDPVRVSRANRLALGAANAKTDSRLDVIGLLALPEWNGRLQAPRAELNAIADVRDGKKSRSLSATERDARVAKMITRLHWLVTYSAPLQPQGPWLDYAARHSELVKADPQYWPHAAENKTRKGRSKLILSRLPNLRILSVDLGHRYAAACAVWEAISTKEIQTACDSAGCGKPTAESLYWFVPRTLEGQKRGRIVYRRIGADVLPDGSPHPAPWARLDRQFLIKLQGEDQPTRMATPDERAYVESLENELGYQRREPRRAVDWRIDELMSDVLRTIRLALRNHGDYARIAGGLIAEERSGMGNRPATKLAGEALIDHLAGLLDLWHELAHSTRWKDEFAKSKWDEHIVPRLKGLDLVNDTEEMTPAERKAARNQRCEQLKAVALQLASENRTKLAAEWQQEWLRRDGTPAVTANEVGSDDKRTGKAIVVSHATGWHATFKWLNRWIMPPAGGYRGKTAKERQQLRNVGGLSIQRIANFKSLYQLQKAFSTRQRPNNQKPNPAPEGFGKRTLTALERMRENRVKQLASRIVEAALGIGVEQSRTNHGKQPPRPRERRTDPRFAPCHAVVIENLTNYRPDELQTRRENRQLMSWASGQVKKHLTDQCKLHGLHLREVQPGYTSRQDFRTGDPGVRCVDVPVEDFLGGEDRPPGRHVRQAVRSLLKAELKSGKQATDWTTQLEAAWSKVNAATGTKKPGTAWDRYVLAAHQHWTAVPAEKRLGRCVRIPQKGGEIFVSAKDEWPNEGNRRLESIQADLNAAGNIGLRALLDPDWHGAWWYIPATLEDGWRVPAEKSTAGAACLKNWKVGESESGCFQSQSDGGRPLSLADDLQVETAKATLAQARSAWEAAKLELREAKKGPRGKSSLTVEAAQALEATAKATHEQAKKDHAAARKSARTKSIVNLWRFLSERSPHGCEWREYRSFESRVRWRVIQRLMGALKLDVTVGQEDE